jgi:hypothetical protein
MEQDDQDDLIETLMKAFKVMLANATSMIQSVDPCKNVGGSVEVQHWEEREQFCR